MIPALLTLLDSRLILFSHFKIVHLDTVTDETISCLWSPEDQVGKHLNNRAVQKRAICLTEKCVKEIYESAPKYKVS